MIPTNLGPFEQLRAELVEALSRMVQQVVESGKGEVSPGLAQFGLIRETMAEVAGIDDFIDDLAAAERALLLYLLT